MVAKSHEVEYKNFSGPKRVIHEIEMPNGTMFVTDTYGGKDDIISTTTEFVKNGCKNSSKKVEAEEASEAEKLDKFRKKVEGIFEDSLNNAKKLFNKFLQ